MVASNGIVSSSFANVIGKRNDRRSGWAPQVVTPAELGEFYLLNFFIFFFMKAFLKSVTINFYLKIKTAKSSCVIVLYLQNCVIVIIELRGGGNLKSMDLSIIR